MIGGLSPAMSVGVGYRDGYISSTRNYSIVVNGPVERYCDDASAGNFAGL